MNLMVPSSSTVKLPSSKATWYRRQTVNPFVRFNFIAFFCVTLLAAAPSFAKPGPLPGTNGAYNVVFAGDYVGVGKAVAGAKSVKINANVKDDKTGAIVHFHVNNLDLEDGRFHGTGDIDGVVVNVSGRIEAPDGNLVVRARILISFVSADGKTGRICGEKKKGAP